MKTNLFVNRTTVCMKSVILLCMALLLPSAIAGKGKNSQKKVISYVDTSLNGSQKYVLRVDDKPFYMTNVQVRFDKLRYRWNWDIATCERLIKETAALGFNTLSIPIHWVEVEPAKDKFDWTTLDLYMGLAQKYNFRVEMLWFGQNSGGHVQWLKPDQLRTPDYVMHSPKAGDFQSFSTAGSSKETTSEFTIRRDISDYTLDLNDKKLCAREAYVLGKVMEHIARWDAENGARHTLIGVQLNNEVRSFPSSTIVEYMSELGRAVKESPYSVWTRMNCTYVDLHSVLYANEQMRSTSGTYIDFVGIDTYRHHFQTEDSFAESTRTNVPYVEKNFRMIMEIGARVPNIAQLHLAALSGNNAFDYYELCGSDDLGIFVQDEKNGFAPRGIYLEDVKLVNKMLNSIMTDIAVNASRYGLFVHNWKGDSLMPTVGVEGISFTPGYINSQAVSILRSGSEIVLATSKGGVFSWPDSLNILSASKGYFDAHNNWVDEGAVDFRIDKRKRIVTLDAGVCQTVRLVRAAQPMPSVVCPAEHMEFGGGVVLEADAKNCIGFTGAGYLNFPLAGGYAIWKNVDGKNGGRKTIRLRYANGKSQVATPSLIVNGVQKRLRLPSTYSWDTYQYVEVAAELKPGTDNVIRLESSWDGAGHVAEFQLMEE